MQFQEGRLLSAQKVTESLVTELYTTPGNIRDRVRGSDDEAICRLKLAPGNTSSSARHGELLGAKWMVVVQGS